MGGYRVSTSSFGQSDIGPGIRWLLIATVGVFVAEFLLTMVFDDNNLFAWFRLQGSMVVGRFAIWQLVTYLFLHAVNNPLHLVFNMFNLWMFGKELERIWGTKQFLRFYFVCGVFAGLCSIAVSFLLGTQNIPVVGASGAIFGILIAFAMLFPDLPTLFFGILPIKMKWLVAIMVLFSVFSLLRGSNVGGELAHLGGLLAGFLWLRYHGMTSARPTGSSTRRKPGLGPIEWAKQQYQQYKLQQNKKKFEEYMRKRDRERYH